MKLRLKYFLAALAVTLAIPSPGRTAVVTINTVTFDDALSADTASIVLGSPTGAGISATVGFSPNTLHSGAYLLGISVLGGPSAGADLGDQTTREIIRVSWSGKYLKDQSGDDFAIAEQGGSGSAEAFAVALKPVGGSLTGYYFFSAGGFDNQHFLTGFNITDFGLSAGTEIEYLQIENLLDADFVSGSGGEGLVVGVAGFAPAAGSFDTDGVFPSGSKDPDIGYVFAAGSANLVAVPEPSSLALFGFASLVMLYLTRRPQFRQ